MKIGRAAFLKSALVGFAGLASTPVLWSKVCSISPGQALGPFYDDHDDNILVTDLTRLPEGNALAKGEQVFISGTVRDKNCQPLADTLVEIWQANKYGRYHHRFDSGNQNPIDPNFRGWGQMLTNKAGRFAFKTIKPGSYWAGQDWRRPRHVHFKVSKKSYQTLVTQMYFRGDPLLKDDYIFNALKDAQKKSLVISFKKSAEAIYMGNFDLTLA